MVENGDREPIPLMVIRLVFKAPECMYTPGTRLMDSTILAGSAVVRLARSTMVMLPPYSSYLVCSPSEFTITSSNWMAVESG